MKESIQQMIDWIEDKLQGEFSLDGLASHMGYSPYYCSFKFHQVTGLSIRRYMLLRRLYLSTGDLGMNRKIMTVAVDYNYSSQEAYSRAFKEVFGISPSDFQRHQMPVQSIARLMTYSEEGANYINIRRETEVAHLQSEKSQLFDQDVLNILNGQVMYEEFKSKKLMGNSDYAPFNEAMCVHETTLPIFDSTFIQTRALGHEDSIESYSDKVIQPLTKLNQKNYNYIVLWFGEDLFCQMNLLTVLAYLEQSNYRGTVYLNSFREDEFKVIQTELTLGNYQSVYEEVLVNHKKPTHVLLPVMYQAIKLYLEMLTENNPVTNYIARNKQLSQSELLKQLFEVFPMIGYGDTQYIELINKVRLMNSNDHV
ncbi:AraC family transcriptional regulator [Sporosarcina sp. BI001-red]|uniref:helix-turn-helix transcriptional regulator n=1 Tax=Sporosarcina sp. BI001-red TaxID=2282866 RepID=UPI000E21F741|nr:AraC family transcriptional regulator [Sporosarcina sp. BI001-red]REB08125.1 AraC family transcriptional regulator [Sporosarcina sp. BI001-red]